MTVCRADLRWQPWTARFSATRSSRTDKGNAAMARIKVHADADRPGPCDLHHRKAATSVRPFKQKIFDDLAAPSGHRIQCPDDRKRSSISNSPDWASRTAQTRTVHGFPLMNPHVP